MKKLLVRFFLLLTIFLLGGKSALYANVYTGYSNDHSVKKIESSETVNPDYEGQDFIIKYVLSDIEQEDFEWLAIDDSETEEEKLTSFRKCLAINNYFTSSFCTQASQYFSYHIKKRLSLHKQFFYFISSSRYITFRVIRL
ncbi:hypothetical protein E0W68_02915 [Flavobacterium salilacus subsp. salilacus]|uniref:hypothetical protein n=1 Tax=Flavobacterium TaxID=237 RepID=UPI001074DDC0|nr:MULTISPECIES: hypothetical protein [Flavobacterium]KAF2520191.1 hypothetical protein E0W68_02915 [Flavobacterium salilacus subsp. salilacus]MBE1613892.1 hypothetical protein [Flavobacterium sp. SaA2.13]